MKKKNRMLAGIVTIMSIAMTGCGDNDTLNDQNNMTEAMTGTLVQDTTIEENSTSSEQDGTKEQSETSSEQDMTKEEPSTTLTQEPATQAPDYEEFMDYRIEKLNAEMRVEEGINVRSGPDTSFEKLGGLAADQTIMVTGKCVETGWYRLQFEGETGFVIGDYLVAVSPEQVTGGLILGDECPYTLLVKTTYKDQIGWFYTSEGQQTPENHDALVQEIMETDGYTVQNEPVYVGGWRDVGDVMWIGYSKS